MYCNAGRRGCQQGVWYLFHDRNGSAPAASRRRLAPRQTPPNIMNFLAEGIADTSPGRIMTLPGPKNDRPARLSLPLWNERFAAPLAPTTAAEMHARGWDAVDVVFVSGDAYVDHPSFAVA